MAEDYVQTIKALMPVGAAWTRSLGAVWQGVYQAIAAEAERLGGRVDDLLLEMDPRTVTEMIADWERIAGLPDLCADPPTTLAGRRHALTARIISRGGWSGGPSVPFLASVIEALGYAADGIIIRRFHLQPFTAQSECDDYLYSDEQGWIFVWEFIVRSGELDEVVMCEIYRYALEHLGLTFSFPLVLFQDGVFTRSGSSAIFTDPDTGVQSYLNEDELGTVYYGV